ncbi:hypothetical protein [Paenibacillus oryzisoli]|nr:hypothetical protein [Paenibacillus oryzisoli]
MRQVQYLPAHIVSASKTVLPSGKQIAGAGMASIWEKVRIN